ncbi:MAG: dTDP-4-amino-4,6-dideoxygalactose transaminase [Pseudohongiellaceae bacterium]|jgi:dTDP-4-amino-4,6-dideoxygalactose transaminase
MRCLDLGRIDGDGPCGQQVEGLLEALTGSPHVLLTNSGTAALELALELHGVGPGHEVICPSFTFPSTANAVLRVGARPVFADVSPATLCLDPDDVATLASPATRAVIPVDYAGIGCDISELRQVCPEGTSIIEDAAHGVGALLNGRHLGVDADSAALSFHASKNITSGEGGALMVPDDALAKIAEVRREKGTNRAAFLRGEVDHYEWVDTGTSATLAEPLAAILLAQLARVDELTDARRRLVSRYRSGLAAAFDDGWLRPLSPPANAQTNGHLFAVRARDLPARKALQAGLADVGIEAPIHFAPLHESAFAKNQLEPQRPLPVTTDAGATLLRLPLFAELSDESQDRVIERILQLHAGAVLPR